MDKYQLVLIEIEVALNSIIKMGLGITGTYAKGARKKKDVKQKTEAEIAATRALKEIPKDIELFEATINKYGCVNELDSLNPQLNEMTYYLKRQIDDTNMVIAYACREMYPLTAKLCSLMHIARAHPDDALKRAKNIMNRKVSTTMPTATEQE